MGELESALLRFDDPIHWEYPPRFAHRESVVRFRAVARDLSNELGVELRMETETQIQDASFHSQIYLPGGWFGHHLIRFSNFGDMVSINEDDGLPPDLLERIQEILSRHGYVYIPYVLLEQPYTGVNPGVTGIATWWIRYFDWV